MFHTYRLTVSLTAAEIYVHSDVSSLSYIPTHPEAIVCNVPLPHVHTDLHLPPLTTDGIYFTPNGKSPCFTNINTDVCSFAVIILISNVFVGRVNRILSQFPNPCS
jgi:hypothetical protein